MPSVSNFTKGISIQVPNRYTNESDYWMFADFPVAYDPCTCLFSSRLRFSFNLIQSTDADLNITLDGTGYVKQVIKKQPNGGVNVNNEYFPGFNWVDGLVTSGTKGYNSYTSFQTAASVANGFLNLNSTPGNKAIGQFANLMSLGNAIPYLGGMLGVFDFLMGGGRTDAKDAGPAAFEANLNFKLTGSATGKLNLSIPRGDRIIKTPGSLVDGTAAVPTYDNVLGVFALVNTPTVSCVTYRNTMTTALGGYCRNPDYDPYCNLGYDENGQPLCGPESYFTSIGTPGQLAQYRLSGDLSYAINPAANLQLTDIKAALVVENVKSAYGGFLTQAATFGDVSPFSSNEEALNKMGYESETDSRFRTPFLPIGCLGSTTAIVSQNGRTNYAGPYEQPTIYVKIRAVFTRNNAGPGTQQVIYLATYKVNVGTPQNVGEFEARYTPNPQNEACSAYYPDYYYYALKTPAVFPMPLQGIAGVTNPNYPSDCSRIVNPRTSTQLQQFCQSAGYNPVVNARLSSSGTINPQPLSVASFACYPNPATGVSTITYTLDASVSVSVELLDNMGKVVQQLLAETTQVPGSYKATFNATKLVPGLYHCVLQTGTQRQAIKVIIAP